MAGKLQALPDTLAPLQRARRPWPRLVGWGADALASFPDRTNLRGRREMNLTRAMKIAQTGFDVWAAKPHNKRWAKMIDGTPIPNDLPVCIAHEFALVLGLEEARPAPVVDREAAWLIEWPASRQMPVR